MCGGGGSDGGGQHGEDGGMSARTGRYGDPRGYQDRAANSGPATTPSSRPSNDTRSAPVGGGRASSLTGMVPATAMALAMGVEAIADAAARAGLSVADPTTTDASERGGQGRIQQRSAAPGVAAAQAGGATSNVEPVASTLLTRKTEIQRRQAATAKGQKSLLGQ